MLLIFFCFCFVPDNDLLQNIFDDNIVEIDPVYEQGIKHSGYTIVAQCVTAQIYSYIIWLKPKWEHIVCYRHIGDSFVMHHNFHCTVCKCHVTFINLGT